MRIELIEKIEIQLINSDEQEIAQPEPEENNEKIIEEEPQPKEELQETQEQQY